MMNAKLIHKGQFRRNIGCTLGMGIHSHHSTLGLSNHFVYSVFMFLVQKLFGRPPPESTKTRTFPESG